MAVAVTVGVPPVRVSVAPDGVTVLVLDTVTVGVAPFSSRSAPSGVTV